MEGASSFILAEYSVENKKLLCSLDFLLLLDQAKSIVLKIISLYIKLNKYGVFLLRLYSNKAIQIIKVIAVP